MHESIVISGARQHNLKNISLEIPTQSLVAFTGVSGAGKSSLVYDTIFAEAQRLFLESLSLSSLQFFQQLPRAEVDSIHGLSPALALRQSAIRSSTRVSVGTASEIYEFIRLLFGRFGHVFCEESASILKGSTPLEVAFELEALKEGTRLRICAPLKLGMDGERDELLEQLQTDGYTRVLLDNEEMILEDVDSSALMQAGSLAVIVDRVVVKPGQVQRLEESVALCYQLSGGSCMLVVNQIDDQDRLHFSQQALCERCGLAVSKLTESSFSFNSILGACPSCGGTGQLELASSSPGSKKQKYSTVKENNPQRCLAEGAVQGQNCQTCGGLRVAAPARIARVGDLTFADAVTLPLSELSLALNEIELAEKAQTLIQPILQEIQRRIKLLSRLQLDHLSLHTSISALSSGESRRLQLASHIGSELSGVLYIIDEPSTGLDPANCAIVIEALRELVARGNTVLLVEHDLDFIRAADYVVELGHGAGESGGAVTAAGSLEEFSQNQNALTAAYLNGSKSIQRSKVATPASESPAIHCFRGDSKAVDIPLGALTVVSGVSGVGKTRFLQEVVLPGLRDKERSLVSGAVDEIYAVVDFSSGLSAASARSTPATLVGVYDAIRQLFASLPEAKVRGWGPGRFSFNVKGGRCEHCGGTGITRLAAQFLPDLLTECELCQGSRFNATTAEVKYKGYGIGDILAMSAQNALALFAALPRIQRRLSAMSEIGVGYLTLGQSADSLSGGEVQRVRLAAEIAKSFKGHTFYVFDEPTAGLHQADVAQLIEVWTRLVELGHTVVVAEHMQEVIQCADWTIELTP